MFEEEIRTRVDARVQANALFKTMLDVAREDFRKLSDHGKKAFFEVAYHHFRARYEGSMAGDYPVPSLKVVTPEETPVVADAMKSIERLQATCINEEFSGGGQDYIQSVYESATEMYANIDRTKRVTEPQLRAIANWTEGVKKWLFPF